MRLQEFFENFFFLFFPGFSSVFLFIFLDFVVEYLHAMSPFH